MNAISKNICPIDSFNHLHQSLICDKFILVIHKLKAGICFLNLCILSEDHSLQVYSHEPSKNHLAVKSICESTVSRDFICKILYFIGSLKATCHETTEGSDQRGKQRDNDCVELHWSCVNHELPEWSETKYVVLSYKYWIKFT